jgi:hypothetical protein
VPRRPVVDELADRFAIILRGAIDQVVRDIIEQGFEIPGLGYYGPLRGDIARIDQYLGNHFTNIVPQYIGAPQHIPIILPSDIPRIGGKQRVATIDAGMEIDSYTDPHKVYIYVSIILDLQYRERTVSKYRAIEIVEGRAEEREKELKDREVVADVYNWIVMGMTHDPLSRTVRPSINMVEMTCRKIASPEGMFIVSENLPERFIRDVYRALGRELPVLATLRLREPHCIDSNQTVMIDENRERARRTLASKYSGAADMVAKLERIYREVLDPVLDERIKKLCRELSPEEIKAEGEEEKRLRELCKEYRKSPAHTIEILYDLYTSPVSVLNLAEQFISMALKNVTIRNPDLLRGVIKRVIADRRVRMELGRLIKILILSDIATVFERFRQRLLYAEWIK